MAKTFREMLEEEDRKLHTKEVVVERLARALHEIWFEEKFKQGWEKGPEHDEEKKISPYMTRYDKLPEEKKEAYRKVARMIEETLSGTGFKLEFLHFPLPFYYEEREFVVLPDDEDIDVFAKAFYEKTGKGSYESLSEEEKLQQKKTAEEVFVALWRAGYRARIPKPEVKQEETQSQSKIFSLFKKFKLRI